MRMIGSDVDAKKFSAYLTKNGITNSVDGETIWVHNEDQLAAAMDHLKRFQANRSHPEFNVKPTFQPVSQEEIDEEPTEVLELLAPRRMAHFTTFLIAFCVMIYFLSAMQEMPFVEKGIPPNAFVPTHIQSTLLFDVPPVVEDLQIAVENYHPAVSQPPPPLPLEIQAKIAAVNTTPFWRGLGDYFYLKFKGEDPTIATGPLFTKIKEGEFWRLLSPVFLHGSILHILFNMLWLWILGKQIELRIGIPRYLLITVLIGVFANVVQYLTTGPFFLGYSGIITGLAGFIWSREKVAPWEGYPLQKSMILFLVLFVVAMSGLQAISLGLSLFTNISFNLNIANSAHIAGAVLGVILGRLNFFEARPPS